MVLFNLEKNQCDKCGKWFKYKLHKVPFLYMDKNDDKHEDMSARYNISEQGYRQYYVCNVCYKRELRIMKRQKEGIKDV